MTALPAAADFTGAAVTEAQFKTKLTDLIGYLSGLLDTPGTSISALQKLGAIGNAVVDKTAGYTVVAADRGKIINCDGTFTLAFTAAATLGSFAFAVRNSGTGTITLDPDLAETIDGVATVPLAAGESCIVVCNGTAFYTVGKSSSDLPNVQTFDASGTWTKPDFGRYAVIEAWGGGGGGGRQATTALGGQGGIHTRAIFSLSDLTATVTVTVGAAGAGRTGSAGTGTSGGDSTFGAYLTAKGGGGGGLAVNGFSPANFAAGSRYIGGENAPTPVSGANASNSFLAAGTGGSGEPTTCSGGTSCAAGAGGAGGDGTRAPVAGTAPGGGGGGGSGVNGANGAAGRIRITVI